MKLCISVDNLVFLTRATQVHAAKPLKIFILTSQSNMQGYAHFSTFDSTADAPKTVAILKEMRNADGIPRVCERIWVSSIACLDERTKKR